MNRKGVNNSRVTKDQLLIDKAILKFVEEDLYILIYPWHGYLIVLNFRGTYFRGRRFRKVSREFIFAD